MTGKQKIAQPSPLPIIVTTANGIYLDIAKARARKAAGFNHRAGGRTSATRRAQPVVPRKRAASADSKGFDTPPGGASD